MVAACPMLVTQVESLAARVRRSHVMRDGIAHEHGPKSKCPSSQKRVRILSEAGPGVVLPKPTHRVKSRSPERHRRPDSMIDVDNAPAARVERKVSYQATIAHQPADSLSCLGGFVALPVQRAGARKPDARICVRPAQSLDVSRLHVS